MCRLLSKSKAQTVIKEMVASKAPAREGRPVTSPSDFKDAEPRRPCWANWITSEFQFHSQNFVLPPEPELPFASISLGVGISEVIYIETSPDRRLIAVCDSSGKVAILANGLEYTTTLRQHQRAVRCCDFSKDSMFLVAASDDNTVSVWSLVDKFSSRIVARCLRIIKHDGAARLCRYDPTGQILCTAGGDGIAYMWFIPCWTNEDNNPRFAPASAAMQPIREHCKETASCVQTILGHTSYVTSCCWSELGDIFVTGSFDQTARIHRRTDFTSLWACTECLKFTAPVLRCDFDGYDTILMLFFQHQDSMLAYDLNQKTTLKVGPSTGTQKTAQQVRCNCFQRQQGWVATYADPGYLSVYSRRTSEWKQVVHIRCNFLDGLAQFCTFSQDGTALILGFNGKLRIWRTEYLVQIPDCVSLFREIKYRHKSSRNGTDESRRDDSLTCIELFRALTYVGYCYHEICKIADTMQFHSHRRRKSIEAEPPLTGTVQDATSIFKRQLTVADLKLQKTIAIFLSCRALRDGSVTDLEPEKITISGSDKVTTSGKYNPIAVIFNAEEKEIGRTEIAYNTADPEFMCPILLTSQTERTGQILTVKVFNSNPLLNYKDFVNEAPVLAVFQTDFENLLSINGMDLILSDRSPGTIRIKVFCLDIHNETMFENGARFCASPSSRERVKTNSNESLFITLPELMKSASCFKVFGGGMSFIRNFAAFYHSRFDQVPAWLNLEAEILARDIFALEDIEGGSSNSLLAILNGLGVIAQPEHSSVSSFSPDWCDVCLCIAYDSTKFKNERDCLLQHVFPALQHLCRSLRVNFSWIESDTCSNSTTVSMETSQNQLLNIALESMELCRVGDVRAKKFFMSMIDVATYLGMTASCSRPPAVDSRYSWVNEQSYSALSIDEILMHAAFLRNSSNAECIFYFRSHDRLDSVMDTTEKTSAVEVMNRNTAAAVKKRLEKLGMLRRLLDGCSSLKSFSVFALTRLWEVILSHHGERLKQPFNPLNSIKSQQEKILALYSTGYVETAHVKDKLSIFEKAALNFPCHLVCYGMSGSGKTSLAAHISATKLQQGMPCIYYFGGFGDEFVLHYLCVELSQMYMQPLRLEQIKHPAQILEQALKTAAIHLRKEEILFIILDNISPPDAFVIVSVVFRLSKEFRIRCIFNISSPSKTVPESFEPIVREWSNPEQANAAAAEALGKLDKGHLLFGFHLDSLEYSKQERIAMADVMCSRFGIICDKRIRIQILGQDIKPVPLFIFSFTARLSSSRVSRNSVKMNLSPKSSEDLFSEAILERSEFGWERDFVDDVICFLSICRRGLPMALVVEMVQRSENSSSGHHTLMNVILPLRPFLKPWTLVSDHLDFLHSAYKSCVLQHYCVDSNLVKAGLSKQKITLLHKKISAILVSLADPNNDKSWRGFCSIPYIDLVYHLYQSVMGDHKDRASLNTIVEVVCNLRFILGVINRHPLKSNGLLEQYEFASNVLRTLRDLEDISKSLQADAIDAQIQQVQAFEDFIRSNKDTLDAKQGSLVLFALQAPNAVVRNCAAQELESFCSALRENTATLQNLLEKTKSDDLTVAACCSLLSELGKMHSNIYAFVELGCLQVLTLDNNQELYIQTEDLLFEVKLNLRSAFLSKLGTKTQAVSKQYGLLLNDYIPDQDSGIQDNISKLEALHMQMIVCNSVPWTDLGNSWETLFTRKSFYLQFSRFLHGSFLNSIRQTLFCNTTNIDNLFQKYRSLFSEEFNMESAEAHSSYSFSESSQISLKAIWIFLEDCDLLEKTCSLALVNRWGISMQKANSQVPILIESDWHKGEKIFQFQDFLEYILRIAQVRHHNMPFLQALDKLCSEMAHSASQTRKVSREISRFSFIREVLCNEEVVSILKSDVDGMLITHEKRLLSCFEHFAEYKSNISDKSIEVHSLNCDEEPQDITQQNKEQSYLTLQNYGFAKLCKSIGLVENMKLLPTTGQFRILDQDWDSDSKWEMTFVEFLCFITSIAHVSQQGESLADSLRLFLSKLEPIEGTQAVAFDPQAPAGSLWSIVGFRVRANEASE